MSTELQGQIVCRLLTMQKEAAVGSLLGCLNTDGDAVWTTTLPLHSHQIADVANLQTELTAISGDVQAVETSVAGLTTAVQAVETSVVALETVVDGKEPSLPAAGTSTQYLSGSKTWQELDVAAVTGLVTALAAKADQSALDAAVEDLDSVIQTVSGFGDVGAALGELEIAVAGKEASLPSGGLASDYLNGSKAFVPLNVEAVFGLSTALATLAVTGSAAEFSTVAVTNGVLDANDQLRLSVPVDGSTVLRSSNGSVQFQNSAGTSLMTLNANGQLVVNATSTVSDARLKREIKPLDQPLDRLCALGGYTYEMVASPGVGRAGVMAQEVASILPEAVSTSPTDGTLSVDYNGLVGLLIGALKEETAARKALEERMNEFERVTQALQLSRSL